VEVDLGSFSSYFSSLSEQSEEACRAIRNNPEFDREFNVVGISQGALIGRYIVESCEMKGRVRNYLSIGGPQMGVTELPWCSGSSVCGTLDYFGSLLASTSVGQYFIGPFGLSRDPNNYEDYLESNQFLPYLNNEKGTEEAKAARKKRFSNLNGAMFVLFTRDDVVIPPESEWFQ
jgi:palmitoyl-protein thioesterase